MRREKFSIAFHARPELASGSMRVGPSSIVPTRLRQVDRLIVAPGEKRSAAWTLRNYAERDRFRPAQLRGRLIEINQTGRANAFDVTAIRREIQIRFQD